MMAAFLGVGADPREVFSFSPCWTEGEIMTLVGANYKKRQVKTSAGMYTLIWRGEGLLNSTATLIAGDVILGNALFVPPWEEVE